MIKVTCNCGATLQVQDEYAGKRGKCPRCSNSLSIPHLELKADEDLDLFNNPLPSALAQKTRPSIKDNAPTRPSSLTIPRPGANSRSSSLEARTNPYESPRQLADEPASSSAANGSTPQLIVVGDHVAGLSPMILPLHCIKCGTAISPTEIKTINVTYFPFWRKVIGLLTILIGMVMIVHFKGVIHGGLCASHRKRRNINRLIFVTMLLIGLALFAVPIFIYRNSKGSEGVPIVLAGVAVMVASFFFLVLKNQLLSARRYQEGVFFVKGFGEEFLKKIGEQEA